MDLKTIINKNGERNKLSEIIEAALKKPLTPSDQNYFKESSFRNFLDLSAEIQKTPVDIPVNAADMPKVMSEIFEANPNFFSNVGINARFFHYEHPQKNIVSDKMTAEERRKFFDVKLQCNEFISDLIRNSVCCNQISKDYDVVAFDRRLEQELAEKQEQMRTSRLDAFRYASKRSIRKPAVVMRVIELDGRAPHAIPTALDLIVAGVEVYNGEKGEKYGVLKIAESVQNASQKLHKIRTDFDMDERKLSDETHIDKGKLEKYETGKLEIDYDDALALQDYFSRQMGAPNGIRFVQEKNVMFMFYRDFPVNFPMEQTQATGTQFHKRFLCASLEWDNAYNMGNEHIENLKRERETKQITRDYLINRGFISNK